MVKANLSYNPYLVKTEIKFNNNKPRINNMVHQLDLLSIFLMLSL